MYMCAHSKQKIIPLKPADLKVCGIYTNVHVACLGLSTCKTYTGHCEEELRLQCGNKAFMSMFDALKVMSRLNLLKQ